MKQFLNELALTLLFRVQVLNAKIHRNIQNPSENQKQCNLINKVIFDIVLTYLKS